MAEIFVLVLMAVVGIAAAACAIGYFWQLNFWRAVGYAFFLGCVIVSFGATGCWIGQSRLGWGFLFPIFLAILILGWAAIWLFLWLKKRMTHKK